MSIPLVNNTRLCKEILRSKTLAGVLFTVHLIIKACDIWSYPIATDMVPEIFVKKNKKKKHKSYAYGHFTCSMLYYLFLNFALFWLLNIFFYLIHRKYLSLDVHCHIFADCAESIPMYQTWCMWCWVPSQDKNQLFQFPSNILVGCETKLRYLPPTTLPLSSTQAFRMPLCSLCPKQLITRVFSRGSEWYHLQRHFLWCSCHPSMVGVCFLGDWLPCVEALKQGLLVQPDKHRHQWKEHAGQHHSWNWMPVASFTKEVYPGLAKCPLVFNGPLWRHQKLSHARLG